MTSAPFWQAKIWGLLHDPPLKALHDNSGRAREGAWQSLACMEDWISPKAKSHTASEYSTQWLKHIGLCDLIAAASDRAALGRLPVQTAINYDTRGLEIRHLLSGAKQTLQLEQWHQFLLEQGQNRSNWLTQIETNLIPEQIRTCDDSRQVYWWLWRCYPVALASALNGEADIPNEPTLPLLPADTRIPDASVWSHTTMTSALAGALAGYYPDASAYPHKRGRKGKDYFESRPYVGIFSFAPVQELIKASRKMRDFWAGSWLLHYLSAKVAWAIAWKYGPDTLLYPCLYAQPLIDLWLLKQYPHFAPWIEAPNERQLLTAGFPNVLVTILPNNGAEAPDAGNRKNPVSAAMQQAEQTLRQEWLAVGKQVISELQEQLHWMPSVNPHTWTDWLDSQWQTYWTALPIGDANAKLHHSPRQPQKYQSWEKAQNAFARPPEDLLTTDEAEFVRSTYEAAVKKAWEARPDRPQSYKARQPNLNVGSWWANIFDRTRYGLASVKKPRTWEIPSAFGPRSTISGIGPVVHSGSDWVTEGETQKQWQRQVGLFDGIEELNATEVLKRGLHRILPTLLTRPQTRLELYYPDLTSGVAGWLRTHPEAVSEYRQICETIRQSFPWLQDNNTPGANQWGIPWVAQNHPHWPNPRALNAGWAIEAFEPSAENSEQVFTKTEQKQKIQDQQEQLREAIAQWFPPGSNPTDWYVLAAGDGDGMSNWLKGEPLQPYRDYLPEDLASKIDTLSPEIRSALHKFLQCKKRMGPATHQHLSRALLDFSNQLTPYLTEARYAGRLIYGGGDDVLAYTNLWEWDSWLWDIRQCFKGAEDPQGEFANQGDYWRWTGGELPSNLAERPLFTMGSRASISFGIAIAHHSVPLAIALENLWKAEEGAKDHRTPLGELKDAVQVRVMYGNGNILTATAKFDAFCRWRSLLNLPHLESGLFEQAATLWSQHPAPSQAAIAPWTIAFCSRRDAFRGNQSLADDFRMALSDFLERLYLSTEENQRDREIKNWLKLAAFVLRNRDIKLGGER
ncbi:type III-B CRISPR-associated protein Cas10/Cmr2 [Phormidium sp. CCY1219]|uniref:type III-B CRISPR-associated protein Cas10/Cmr2 n=1 Tax=Phormidium sp. CCY1219 TaxID=2886104 RepID=UPI002D1ED6DB|nr:type III-B CRISPR-associated protein Cas10/Cmr2 [Phormidium sp. CCY1219]MEB3830327.1 type III-B CRISPR-associated protein Cas10/Cmr2 [Phormidium sp. CCY1219]